MSIKIESGTWDDVVNGVDDLLVGFKNGNISRDDVRGHILTLVDTAATDGADFAKIARTIARFAMDRANS